MTRVNEDQEKRRVEQVRMEKQALKDSKSSSDEFAKLVGQKQEQTTKANASAERQKTVASKHQATESRSKASNALLARQGIRAHKFENAMAKNGEQSIQQTKAESLSRGSEQQEVQEFNSQAEQAREKKEMDKQERVQSIRDEDGDSPGGQGGGGAMGGGGGQHQDGSHSGGSLLDAGAVGEIAGGAAAEAQSASTGPRVSPEIIRAIVRQILVGVSEKGLGTVHIDFKGSELEGTSMTVTADGNKIYAKIFTDNRNLGRMFKASHTELARALKNGANLSLESLDVTGAV